MELRDLRVLVAVAEQGSVARAARVLHHSPSSISHALTSLETELGVRLFNRVPRGMVTTEAGEAMLGPARRALREAEAARAAAAAVDGLLAGHLSVVTPRMMAPWLADVVAGFHAVHPLVVVSVHQPEREDAIPELIRTGACELGFMQLDNVPGDLEGTPVGTRVGVVIVPAGHALARQRAVTLAELEGVPFVTPVGRLGPAFEGLFAEAGIVPRVAAEADDGETILELVRAGIGVAIVSADSAATVVGRGAVALPITPARVTTVAVVSKPDDSVTPAAAAFRTVAVARFRDA